MILLLNISYALPVGDVQCEIDGSTAGRRLSGSYFPYEKSEDNEASSFKMLTYHHVHMRALDRATPAGT